LLVGAEIEHHGDHSHGWLRPTSSCSCRLYASSGPRRSSSTGTSLHFAQRRVRNVQMERMPGPRHTRLRGC
jgi:hypothetical protein